MTFGNAISTCFNKFATFEGRARRSEFWYFELSLFLAHVVANLLDNTGLLSAIVGFGTLLPSVAVGCRRLHDTDRSGWWLLLSFIPIIGIIVLIVWFVQRGTAGPNRFGAEPPSA